MTTPGNAVPGLPGPGRGRPTPRPRAAARGIYDRAAASGQRILLAELVACLAIDAVRFAADFGPGGSAPQGHKTTASGTSPHGGKGPLSVLGGILGTFFVLSLLPSRRLAAAAGGVITVALLINSESQIAALAAGLRPPGARSTVPGFYGAYVRPPLADGSCGPGLMPDGSGNCVPSGPVTPAPASGKCPPGTVDIGGGYCA